MSRFRKIALFSDEYGLPMLLACLPKDLIGCVVGAAIRPRSHAILEKEAVDLGAPFLIQPRLGAVGYGRFLEELSRREIDLILCNSYSMLLRADLLAMVGGRAVNAHASLLPKNRGPNPIQWALIRGEAATGVSLHVMDEGFDTGPVLGQSRVDIGPEETWVELREKLGAATAELWRSQLPQLLSEDWVALPQDESAASVNARLNEDSPRIDFNAMSDRQIYDLIRAQVAPLAGAYVPLPDGSRVRFRERVPLEEIDGLRKRFIGNSLSGGASD